MKKFAYQIQFILVIAVVTLSFGVNNAFGTAGHLAPDGHTIGIDAAAIYVSITGSDLTGDGTLVNPFATIQHAINLAVNGDMVRVLSGTYSGTGNRDIDFLGKVITVASQSGDPATCLIDCQGTISDPHCGFIFQNDEGPGSIIRGLTIFNGYATGSSGGGIRCEGSDPWDAFDGASPTIESCIIRNNQGGGISIKGMLANPSFRNCSIKDNQGFGIKLDYGSGSYTTCEIEGNSGSGFTMGDNFESGSPYFDDCLIKDNGGDGLYFYSDFGIMTLLRCTVTGNSGDGVAVFGLENAGLVVQESIISFNGSAGVRGTNYECNVSVSDSEVSNNDAEGVRFGGLYGNSITNCAILDNLGWGIDFSTSFTASNEPGVDRRDTTLDFVGSPVGDKVLSAISHCEIARNQGGGIGAAGYVGTVSGEVGISDCLIHGNDGDGIHADIYNEIGTAQLNITSTTIAANVGRGLFMVQGYLDLNDVLIAFNDFVSVESGATTTIGCTDIYGNAGGDWVGNIIPFIGSNGNISEDPLFCGMDYPLDPYAVHLDSPCAAPNNSACGQIGARGIGCGIEPVMTSVLDVANDQGRKVRLNWDQCTYDVPGSSVVISGYAVYRLQEAYKNSPGVVLSGDKIADWDFIATVPARQDPVYQFIAPTLCDSTILDGLCESTFMISAMTADPGEYFDSLPMAGYSVDNLSPCEPAYLLASYTSGGTQLNWDPHPETGFSHFLIHRTPWNSSDPGGDVRYSGSAESWEDTVFGPDETPWDFRYWIAAVDVSGNKSEFVSYVYNSASDVPGRSMPTATALNLNAPNPFNPRTVISFDLAEDGAVNLKVFDLSGRLVRSLVNGETRKSGRYELAWNGRDDAGLPVAAGVYIYRLEAGEFSGTKRMTLVK